MRGTTDLVCTVFAGERRVASGPLQEIIGEIKRAELQAGDAPLLIFDHEQGRQVELDLRGTLEEAKARLEAASAQTAPKPEQPARGPGRPKLGVVSKEVTLLPRHWEWLSRQRGGASVTLRRLVDEARQKTSGKDQLRQRQESLYRFISVMAGNHPGFEEAARALFAGDGDKFWALTGDWPEDVRDHARFMAQTVF